MVAGPARRPRRPERRHDRARRHRVRALRLLRLRAGHPEHRRAGRRRTALHQFPHDRAVLAVPGGAAHRPQPARGRHARYLQLEHRLPAHARRHLAAGGHGRRTAARPRVRDLCGWQVAPGPDGGVQRRRARTRTGRCRRGSTGSTDSCKARPISSIRSYQRQRPLDPPGGPEDGYHVSEDIVDRATGWIGDLQSVRPDRPFFLYLAFGATHAPHQSPPEYRHAVAGPLRRRLRRRPASAGTSGSSSWASSRRARTGAAEPGRPGHGTT